MAKPAYSVDLGPLVDGLGTSPNNVSDTLNGGITNSATAITVTDGTKFAPIDANHNVFATLDDGINIEVVRITSVAGNVLTVVRAWELAASVGFVFPDGTTIERRITQGLLQMLSPLQTETLRVEIGLGASALGASGIAIGHNAEAGIEAIHINAAPVGDTASSANATSAVGIGSDIVNYGPRTVAIGNNLDESWGAQDCVVIGSFINHSLTNGGTRDVIIGSYIDTEYSGYSVVMGETAELYTYNSVVIGSSAVDSDTPYSVVIGDSRRVFHHGSFDAPPRVCGRQNPDNFAIGPASANFGSSYVHMFYPCDLGVPQVWTTATVYKDMEVVESSAPTGTEQWLLAVGRFASHPLNGAYSGEYNGPASNQHTTIVEPVGFTGGVNGNIVAPSGVEDASGNQRWLCVDPEGVGMYMLATEWGGMIASDLLYKFVPTRIGFYAYATTGVLTTYPIVNFGNELSATAYGTFTFDGWTDATTHQIQWFPLGEGAGTAVQGCDELHIRLTTVGIGGSIMGRFMVEGYFMTALG